MIKSNVKDNPNSKVYFIQSLTSGLIKIGTSKNPKQRIKNIQSEIESDVKILAIIPGGHQLESKLHQRFNNLRVEGEWFQPKADLAEFIIELTYYS